jgi:protein gp37
MGKNSAIEWTHHTFNPWVGCTKVSPECKNCYAEKETFVRVQRGLGRELWGPTADRHVTSDPNWRKPLAWDRAAGAAGERHRVFCASLADVAEDRADLIEPRARLCELIITTPNLDWLLLPKRLDDLVRLFPSEVLRLVWVGTTAGTKERMLEEVPKLANVPARVRFVSVEPLLEDVADELQVALSVLGQMRVHWIIVGGESAKPGDDAARPMHLTWARRVRDVSIANRVAFLFKQWGDWSPYGTTGEVITGASRADFADLPAVHYHRVGKKKAGRLLDGREWNELPDPRC